MLSQNNQGEFIKESFVLFVYDKDNCYIKDDWAFT